jgi:hypothetical protein
MKLTKKQSDSLSKVVAEYVPKIAEAVEEAIQANAIHKRQATVSLSIKVNRDAEKSANINVNCQVKSTVPKSSHEDRKKWTMLEVAFVIDGEEDPNQQKIDPEAK